MASAPLPRRRFVASLAAGAGSAWLGIPWSALSAAAREALGAPQDAPWRVLTPADAAVLEAVAERIIPADESPGAREARVVRFLDTALATFLAGQRPLFRSGLAELREVTRRRHPDAASFATLPSAEQDDILRAFDAAQSAFFEAARVGTIAGMLASPLYGGNHAKAGWRLLGFEDRFVWQAPFGDYDRA